MKKMAAKEMAMSLSGTASPTGREKTDPEKVRSGFLSSFFSRPEADLEGELSGEAAVLSSPFCTTVSHLFPPSCFNMSNRDLKSAMPIRSDELATQVKNQKKRKQILRLRRQSEDEEEKEGKSIDEAEEVEIAEDAQLSPRDDEGDRD